MTNLAVRKPSAFKWSRVVSLATIAFISGYGSPAPGAQSTASPAAASGDGAPARYIGIITGRPTCFGRTAALQYEVDALVRRSRDLADLNAASPIAPPTQVLSTVAAIRGVIHDDDARIVVVRSDGAPLLLARVPDTPRRQLEVLRAGLSVLAIAD